MSEPRMETCEIKYFKVKHHDVRKSIMRWVGEAIGPQGRYIAAKSRDFKDGSEYPTVSGTKESHQALDELIAELARDGWDHVGVYGNYYWEHRFRRRAK